MKAPVVIPAYQPGPELIRLTTELRGLGFERIVVVDDGSTGGATEVFRRLEGTGAGVEIERHEQNRGKGAALRTGIRRAFALWPDAVGVVTADADGQHAPDDIARVEAELAIGRGRLVMGCRALREDAPLRSRIGNRASSFFLRAIAGIGVSDTQTGLRGIPADFARQCLGLHAPGYEFELEMLLMAREQRVGFDEVPIRTIYLDSNIGSHFSPFRDSMRISLVLARFALASIATAVVDNAVFAATLAAGGTILASQTLGRAVAVGFNYWAVRGSVFRSRQRHSDVLPKYLTLVLAHATVSYLLIILLHHYFGAPALMSKIGVEVGLFLVNFLLQREVIFRRPAAGLGSTDWDTYYRAVPATAHLTRRYTRARIIALLARHGLAPDELVVEYGGANSAFMPELIRRFSPSSYRVVDMNEYGLSLLESAGLPGQVELSKASVLDQPLVRDAAVAFSTGLVEHFDGERTRRAILTHFDTVRSGGLVLITFPTPTGLYRAIRAVLEVFGLWKFPDERPLDFEEVERTVAERGDLLHRETLWPLILTQGLVVARKRT